MNPITYSLASNPMAGTPVLAHGGFGLNLDLFEANVVNLAIVLGVLVYFGRGFLTNLLSKRRDEIAVAINEAEAAQAQAAAALAAEQTKLAQAKLEAEKIVSESYGAAERAKAAILKKAEADVARMQGDAAQDLATERDKVAAQLRQRAVIAALGKVNDRLRSQLNPDQQRDLIDQALASIH